MRYLILAATALGVCGCDTDAVSPIEAPSRDTAAPNLEVLATGANIAGANGIHFGPDGFLVKQAVDTLQ